MNEELDHSAGSLLSTEDNKVNIISKEINTTKALCAKHGVQHRGKSGKKKKKSLKSKPKQDSSHRHHHKKNKKTLHEGEETKPRDHHGSKSSPSSPHSRKATKKTSTKTTMTTSHEKTDTTSDETINRVNIPYGSGSDPLPSNMENIDVVVDIVTLSDVVLDSNVDDCNNGAAASDIEAVPVATAVPSSSGGGCLDDDDDDDDGHDMTPITLDSGTGGCGDEATCKPDPEEYIGLKIDSNTMICDDNKDDESLDTDDDDEEEEEEDIENSASGLQQRGQTATNVNNAVISTRNYHQDRAAANARAVARSGTTATNRYSPSGRVSEGDSSCSCCQIALIILAVIIFINVLRFIIISASSTSAY